MDLCLTTIPLTVDIRPVWIRSALTAKSWSKVIQQPKFAGVYDDANYAFVVFDSCYAFVPSIIWKDDILTMEWREEGKFFTLFLTEGKQPRWASGHDGGIVEIESGRPLTEVLPGMAAWLSPPKPKLIREVV